MVMNDDDSVDLSIFSPKAREYLVATVDGFGIVVETIYVILFLIYAPKVTRGRTLILAVILDVAISTVAVVTTQLALQREARGGVVGVMGAGLNIVMYFSPLSAMYEFVLARNVLPLLTTVNLCQRI
ncbi:bidirectional sugar transporter SWEET17-like [Glycine soja]|uniref:bidirectional sugar transporter SWEET17-like n=1 Tax=Glycine soja TaxID=3848 RepID=UPI00103CE078|nr:bidirectional sugar transporter SWEET17-like [Glycine soja]